MSEKNITFILHKPQLSENIGACARAIKNFNFKKLVLINPKPIFPNDKILATSVGAKNISTKSKKCDNLEHALKNLSKDVSDSDKEGIELTLKSFESALDKFGISPIYPISGDFDPIQHEAVSVVKDEKHADNKIVEVMQKGWKLHERVIRPARVVVIKN